MVKKYFVEKIDYTEDRTGVVSIFSMDKMSRTFTFFDSEKDAESWLSDMAEKLGQMLRPVFVGNWGDKYYKMYSPYNTNTLIGSKIQGITYFIKECKINNQ